MHGCHDNISLRHWLQDACVNYESIWHYHNYTRIMRTDCDDTKRATQHSPRLWFVTITQLWVCEKKYILYLDSAVVLFGGWRRNKTNRTQLSDQSVPPLAYAFSNNGTQFAFATFGVLTNSEQHDLSSTLCIHRRANHTTNLWPNDRRWLRKITLSATPLA